MMSVVVGFVILNRMCRFSFLMFVSGVCGVWLLFWLLILLMGRFVWCVGVLSICSLFWWGLIMLIRLLSRLFVMRWRLCVLFVRWLK